ncbi:MAG: DNA polymerase Y family protein [Candidatus Komeilibacteria bacterium]
MQEGKLFTIQDWPRAILHLDADAFFASCEQALQPQLRNQPIVTGAERGIVSAASYEAKALGVTRGMPLYQVKQRWPQIAIVTSDYESYSIFSQRMFSIVRRFTESVEEYSIDEAWADITGLQRPLNSSYKNIADNIRKTVNQELGITISVGVSLNKSLAKLAAKQGKPNGLTMIPGKQINALLKNIPLADIWGFGLQTTAYLQHQGLRTAYDFASRPENWVKQKLTKPGQEIWHELRGQMVYTINPHPAAQQSISKTKTFTPPRQDANWLLAQLVRNLESATDKLRRHHLTVSQISFYLKTQNFAYHGLTIKLDQSVNSELPILPLLRRHFSEIYQPHTSYRATGIVLEKLSSQNNKQMNLFIDPQITAKTARLTNSIDIINHRWGKHTIHPLTSLLVNNGARGNRDKVTKRWDKLLPGENKRQHLHIPRWSTTVH